MPPRAKRERCLTLLGCCASISIILILIIITLFYRVLIHCLGLYFKLEGLFNATLEQSRVYFAGPKISDELRVPHFLDDLYVRCFLLRCVTSFLYHGDYNLASKLFATWIAEYGSTEAMLVA